MNKEKILLGLIYYQILKDKIALSANELGRFTCFDLREIFNSCKKVKLNLNLKNAVIQPETFLQKFCSQLDLSQKTVVDSSKILKKIDFDFSPMTKIAASIYLSSLMNNENTTQRKISDVCSISIQTLRLSLRALRQTKTFNKGIV